jgi:hypothetical protein
MTLGVRPVLHLLGVTNLYASSQRHRYHTVPQMIASEKNQRMPRLYANMTYVHGHFSPSILHAPLSFMCFIACSPPFNGRLSRQT